MIIRFTDYSDDVHYINLSKSTEKMCLEEPFFGDVLLKVKMDKSPHQIVLNCDLTVKAKLMCDRCTEDFERELTNHFQSIYMFGGADEDDNSGIIYLNPDDNKIVLDKIVSEYCGLALPLKILCKEECKGLCVKCGTNLNIKTCDCSQMTDNDVWAPLKKIIDN